MNNVQIKGITIYFDKNGEPFLEKFVKACIKSIPIIYEMWGLGVPEKCKVFIATTWLKFLFCSVSWPEKILNAIIILFCPIKAARDWNRSEGWTSTLYPTSVIKAPTLIASTDKTIREKIFIEELTAEENIEVSICHELVHAFSFSLCLPTWLHEGIAMFTCDKYIGRATVKHETIGFLEGYQHKNRKPHSGNFISHNNDDVVYDYVRCYWLTRWLEQDYPGLIKGILKRHLKEQQIEMEISNRLIISAGAFWKEIDEKIITRFKIGT